MHGLSLGKIVCVGSTIATGFRHELRRILTHCGWEAFHDDDVGLNLGEPLINCPHCRSIGAKGVMGADEYQSLSPFLVYRDKWNSHRAVGRTPRFCLPLQLQ
jgi:hypothetical protein